MSALRLTLVAATALAVAAVPTVASPALSAGPSTRGDAVAASPSAVIRASAAASAAARAGCLVSNGDPLHESRLYAMVHLAVSDAVNAIDRRYQPYALDIRVPAGASADSAVAAAARDVMVSVLSDLPFSAECISAGVAAADGYYADELAAIPPGPAVRHGLAAGRAAAAVIVAQREGDGSDAPLVVSDFPQGTTPGQYRFTPGTPFVFEPAWGDVTPFVLRSAKQFRPPAPYRTSSPRYARDLNEIKALGGDGTTTPSVRTADQTEIARFWYESSPLAWNRLARDLADRPDLDLWEQARMFALLNVSLADGYISSFDTKFHFLFWRPITAIREADADGNRATSADPTWTPLMGTPPIPDYDSAHAVEGAAAARVMARVLGSDRVSFTVCSLTLPAGKTCDDASPVTRSYSRLSQAANENGESRILVGIHFRLAVERGLTRGRQIGDYTVNRFLRPVR